MFQTGGLFSRLGAMRVIYVRSHYDGDGALKAPHEAVSPDSVKTNSAKRNHFTFSSGVF